MRISSISAKKNIGAILKERRIKKGISQHDMSIETNLTQTFISLVEHGKRIPSHDVLQRMAEVLGENAINLEIEAGNADSDSVMKINSHLKRLFGSGNNKNLERLLEFIETLS